MLGILKNFIVLGLLLFVFQAHGLPEIHEKYAADYASAEIQLKSSKFTDDLFIRELQFLTEAYEKKNDFLETIRTTQKVEMEFYLTKAYSGYGPVSGFVDSSVSHDRLTKIIEDVQKLSNPAESHKRELLLGDSYHWLGHLYEERGELVKAYECYVRSYVHYNKTPFEHSPERINPALKVREHAEYHLKEIVANILMIADKVRLNEAIRNYRSSIQPKSCRSLFI